MVPALHLPILISGFPVHAHAFGFAFLPIINSTWWSLATSGIHVPKGKKRVKGFGIGCGRLPCNARVVCWAAASRLSS